MSQFMGRPSNPLNNQTARPVVRQLAAKPVGGNLNPTRPSANPKEQLIRQQLQQLQVLQSRLKIQQERLLQTKMPAMRQNLESQNQQIKKQIQDLYASLKQARGEMRIELLKPLFQSSEDLASQIAKVKGIYKAQQPLPAKVIPLFDACVQSWTQAVENAAAAASVNPTLAALCQELWPEEAELLTQWWQEASGSNATPELEDAHPVRFELPDLPESTHPTEAQSPVESVNPSQNQVKAPVSRNDFEVIQFKEQGTLELSFDMSAKRSVVRNQMGITLNQPKKSYQEYLEIGFAAIDQTVNSHFENRDPLYQAVESFLEAVSQDRSRYEAYFGLGYLYSLVKDINHALYFLDIAWKISGDSTILEMMERVKPAP